MRRLTLLCLLGFGFCALASAGPRPNVILILADDLGYGDVQALNPASRIPTPNLNGLAKDGVTFTDAHSGSAVCTPTRYGLLTGRYCWRSPLKRGVLFPPNDKPLIEDDRLTIASFLKAHGYRTGMVGKWHLGIGWARDEKGEVIFDAPFTNGPIEKGFDQWFGVAASLDMVPYVFLRDHEAVAKTTETQPALGFPRFIRKGPKAPGFDPANILDDLAAEATAFIKQAPAPPSGTPPNNPITNNSNPFFLYLPLTGPHKPVWPHERFVGKTTLGPYGDFVHQVDHTVGVVLKALEESGQADNTIVIFTSDNGSFMYRRGDAEKHHLADQTDQGYRPADHSSNHHWRGTKADVWEGGHRVPFFVRWPRHIPAGITMPRTICLTDVLATVAEAIGEKLPEGAGQDSYSFLPDATQSRTSAGVRPPVIHHSVAGAFAIRRGPWKLVLANGSGGRQQPQGKPFGKPYHLYNLADDPGETNNLIDEKPDLAKELEQEFQAIAGKDL